MVPRRLQLEHFLSYLEPTEVTFRDLQVALLSGENGAGKSSLLEAMTWVLWGKARAASDDDLITHGESTMQVEIELEEEGRLYRVRRQRSRGVRGKTQLYFWSKAAEADDWILQNSTNVRLTEEQISRALRLSYGMFVNSVYLRQGHADEFTTKPAAERKRVLADILDLERWDQLAEQAREEGRGISQRLAFETQRLQTLELEDGQELALAERLEKLRTEQAETEQEISRLETALIPLQAQAREIERLADQERRLEHDQQELAIEHVEKRRRRAQLSTELQDIQRRLEHKEETTKKYDEWLKLQKTVESERIREKEFSRFERERERLSQRLASHERELTERRQFLLRQHDEIIERNRRRAAQLKEAAACPLCARPFTAEHTAEQCIASIRAETAEQLVPTKQAIQTLLEPNQVALEVQAELTAVETTLTTLAFDQVAVQANGQRMRALSGIHDEWSAVQTAGQLQAAKAEQIESFDEELQRLEIRLHETVGALQLAQTERQERQPKLVDLPRLEMDLVTSRQRQQLTAQQVGQLLAEQEQLRERVNEVKRLRQSTTEAKRRLHILEEFIVACGKHGIQTMILEETLPLLEERSNELLAQLSNGTMTLSFETERQKKSGEGMIDTLDILIADTEGTRPYEMYSGGEAFRINVAIRVALSLLLAERANAEIEFLIIDEGFGALDADGREMIVQVLLALKERFKLILIVSHLPEFKELFDQEIVVWKDEQGSHVRVRN